MQLLKVWCQLALIFVRKALIINQLLKGRNCITSILRFPNKDGEII